MSQENNCEFCDIIKSKKGKVIFEDEKSVAMLSPRPFCHGHIIVMPKQHFTIIEQVPDYLMAHLSKIVNKISIAVFEVFQATGTNILINNGINAGQKTNHFMVNILPRKENDGLDFQWNSKQFNEEQMSTIEIKLKEECSGIGDFEKENRKPINADKEIQKIDKEENYLVKQLNRIP
ncbi:MAG: HIT family protein [Candidatus Nanoarchaeia archaeon]|nr:HIT family protein [Candidatus Nanoarchaeia archaeon]